VQSDGYDETVVIHGGWESRAVVGALSGGVYLRFLKPLSSACERVFLPKCSGSAVWLIHPD
jgi:hypothetical protein